MISAIGLLPCAFAPQPLRPPPQALAVRAHRLAEPRLAASTRPSAAAAAALAALLVCSPLQMPDGFANSLGAPMAASAKELASGSGSRVNKDPLSLLRLGLPGQGKEVRELQSALEDSRENLARLLVSQANSDLSKAKSIVASKGDKIVKSAPSAARATASAALAGIDSGIDELKKDIEAKDVNKASAAEEAVLAKLSTLEEAIASEISSPVPPAEFKDLPILQGRAKVEVTIKRDGGEPFDVDGKLYGKQIKVGLLVDGYTAPITAGNFVDLVNKGFYNGMHVQRSDGFVVQTGDPAAEGRGEAHGYVPASGGGERRIPLEVIVKGDKQPMYGATFDEDGRGGYASTLPFNAYGALGMAREERDNDSASSQWFWLLFDSDLTPAGKNLLDGRYACFGYTVDGAHLLSDVKEGDIISSAKVVEGLSNLKTGAAPAAVPDA